MELHFVSSCTFLPTLFNRKHSGRNFLNASTLQFLAGRAAAIIVRRNQLTKSMWLDFATENVCRECISLSTAVIPGKNTRRSWHWFVIRKFFEVHILSPFYSPPPRASRYNMSKAHHIYPRSKFPSRIHTDFCSIRFFRNKTSRPTMSIARTIGQYPTATIVNSSHVEHAALYADEACGAGTRLILYMDIGEVLSRSFTEKDTHSPRGDLVVAFTNTESGHAECDRRAKAASILLGFSPPCFTYGSDLILPAELNGQLRRVLRAKRGLEQATALQTERNDDAHDVLTDDLAVIAEAHHQYASVYIPEVCGVMLCYVLSQQKLCGWARDVEPTIARRHVTPPAFFLAVVINSEIPQAYTCSSRRGSSDPSVYPASR